MSLRVIVLVNRTNIGDDNSARGVAFAIRQNRRLTGYDPSIVEYEISDLDSAISRIASSERERFIIVAAGQHMLKPISDIREGTREQRKRILIVWSAHQVPAELMDNEANLDFIALPKHVINPTLSGRLMDKIIETIGVAHNFRAEILPAALTKYTLDYGFRYTSSSKYMMVILGGDAPDERGVIRRYTAEEALWLGRSAGRRAVDQGFVILATNGARTGKHSDDGQEISQSHRSADELDRVSQAFIDGVTENGATYHFENFLFGNSGRPTRSAYHAMLAVVNGCKDESLVLVPGESTSMISEITSLGVNVLIYTVSSMNSSHIAFVDSVIGSGQAALIRQFEDFPEIRRRSDSATPVSAASIISEAVVTKFRDCILDPYPAAAAGMGRNGFSG